MPYEIFEHTADIGLRVYGKDLEQLFKDAAEGFFNLATDLDVISRTGEPYACEIEMHFQEENAEELLMRWLQELLFLFSTRKLVLTRCRFATLTPMLLKLKAKAVQFDPERHVSRHEIKAVTFHGFRVLQNTAGWMAEVIFDI